MPEAPSTFFFLHSSMMSLYWIAPSISRWTVWPCRNNRVTAFDTSKHIWSLDRCVSMSVHLVSRTGMETGVSVIVGFYLGLAFSYGFHPKLCPLLPWLASVLSHTYQHHSRFYPKKRFCLETEMGPELQLCIGLHDDKLWCPRLGQFSCSWESIFLNESSSRFEAFCILCINVSCLSSVRRV